VDGEELDDDEQDGDEHGVGEHDGNTDGDGLNFSTNVKDIALKFDE